MAEISRRKKSSDRATLEAKTNEAAAPERRASKRLAADLLRFERAFDRLERQRMGLGAIAPNDPVDEPPCTDRDVSDYLNCLDEALKQLAEEFAGDAQLAKALERNTTVDTSAEASIATTILRGPSGGMTSQIDTSAV